MGYTTKKVDVPASQSVLTVYLAESATALDATVVVGYGTTKKVNLTGAVSVVESESISNRSSANLGSILQGTVPGLTVTAATGRPGQTSPTPTFILDFITPTILLLLLRLTGRQEVTTLFTSTTSSTRTTTVLRL